MKKTVFDIQSEETKKLLIAQSLRSEEDDKLYHWEKRLNPVTEKAQCVKEDGSVDLNVRPITKEEESLHQAHRYDRGHNFEGVRTSYLQSKTLNYKLEDKIQTKSVTPKEDATHRATLAFLGRLPTTLKDKFISIMSELFVKDELKK